MSAPCSIGLVITGVVTVASTTNLAPLLCAIDAASLILIISHVGLHGVSIQNEAYKSYAYKNKTCENVSQIGPFLAILCHFCQFMA